MLLRVGKRLREVGQFEAAEHAAREGLPLAATLTDRRRVLQLLDLLAAVAADSGDGQRAAVLGGAVAAELARQPIAAMTTIDHGPGAGVVEVASDRRILDLDEAVGYALR